MGLVNIASMAVQILLLIRSVWKLIDVKTYSFERPTYNILTVIIIRQLQALLVVGVLAQVFRCIFYFYGDDYGREILVRRFGFYYAYEFVMQFIPFMIESIFLV